MNSGILMKMEEPSDKDLSALMKEVAETAKIKALEAKKKLTEIITKEIAEAREKQNNKQR